MILSTCKWTMLEIFNNKHCSFLLPSGKSSNSKPNSTEVTEQQIKGIKYIPFLILLRMHLSIYMIFNSFKNAFQYIFEFTI